MITVDTIETVLTVAGTAITSVGGMKVWDKYRRRERKLDLLHQQMQRIEELTEKVLKHEDELLKLNSENHVLTSEVKRLEAEKEVLLEKIASLEQKIDRLNDDRS